MVEIRERQVGGRTVVALVGAFTTQDVPTVQDRLLSDLETLQRLNVPTFSLIVDLSEMTYIASAGVALFVKLGNRARARGGRLILAQPRSAVQETLAVLRLTSHDLIFQISPTVEDALKI